MAMPSLRPAHGVLFVLVAVLFFGLAMWMQRGGEPAAPLACLGAWQSPLLEPMAEGTLTLAALDGQAHGELWLRNAGEGPQLLFRSEGEGEDACNLEGELALDDAERTSLLKALGGHSPEGEQPLSRQMLDQLGQHRLSALEVRPQQLPDAERLVASVGQPRLRLQLGVGEAWVYPVEGLTAQMVDGQVHRIRVVPRATLKQ